MSSISDQFWLFCKEAYAALDTIDDIQPALDRVLQLVQSAPDAREELGQCFVELIQTRRPWEVAYYCMRHLKWQEVYEAASKEFQENSDFRVTTVMTKIRQAYDDPATEYLY